MNVQDNTINEDYIHERRKSKPRVDRFSLHERGIVRFYDNHPNITNKRLEVTKICSIIYERGKENAYRTTSR